MLEPAYLTPSGLAFQVGRHWYRIEGPAQSDEERRQTIELLMECWNAIHMLAAAEDISAAEACRELQDQAEHRTTVTVHGVPVTILGGPADLHVEMAALLERDARLSEVIDEAAASGGGSA